VPSMRGVSTQVGQSNLSYTRSVAMDSGFAGFDGSSQSRLTISIGTASAPAAGPKLPGPGGRDSKRFTIKWTTAAPVGVRRRSVQTSTAPYSSLSTAIQGIQRRGGRILSIANT
jgi:phycoerythrin-associated linker protein